MIEYRGGMPMVLAASVTLAEPAGAVIPDLGLLQNPYRQPMVIDDILFILKVSAGVIQAAGLNVGGTIRCKLDLGRMGLTSIAIPVWLFGPPLIGGTTVAATFGAQASEAVSGLAGVDVAAANVYVSTFKWKLPVPLFVPPGAVLVPSFQRNSDGINASVLSNIKATIAYNCRRLPDNTPIPEQIAVPYVAAFIGADGAKSTISADRDLYNAFLTKLRVQRFCGRLQIKGGLPVIADLQAQNPNNYTAGTDNPSNILVKMTDTRGRDVIREYTTWQSVFNRARASWTAPSILLPGERFNFYYNAPTGATAPDVETITPMVSMVGWRVETLNV